MTPEDRAKEIIGRWRPYMKVFGATKGFPENEGSMQEDIASQIREAVEEAYQAGFEEYQHHIVTKCAGCATAKAEAFEDAAKIVADAPGNTYTTDCDHEALAATIRARAKEAGK